jgi:DNA-binding transcriptional regulator YiaG
MTRLHSSAWVPAIVKRKGLGNGHLLAQSLPMTGKRTIAEELALIRQAAATGEAKAVRVGARLSLADLAREIGVAPSTVCRWEKGSRSPRGLPAIAYGRLLRRLRRARAA